MTDEWDGICKCGKVEMVIGMAIGFGVGFVLASTIAYYIFFSDGGGVKLPW